MYVELNLMANTDNNYKFLHKKKEIFYHTAIFIIRDLVYMYILLNKS